MRNSQNAFFGDQRQSESGTCPLADDLGAAEFRSLASGIRSGQLTEVETHDTQYSGVATKEVRSSLGTKERAIRMKIRSALTTMELAAEL
jgi:hypothetical protein